MDPKNHKWFGHQSLFKSSVFPKCSKMLKSLQNLLAVKLVYLDTFFQNVAIHRLMKIMTWNQSLLKLRMQNFHDLKQAYWYWKSLLRNSSLKIGPLWHEKIGDFWGIVVTGIWRHLWLMSSLFSWDHFFFSYQQT